ncbi:MAG: sigma-54 dependent transcriptional regulator [Brumimicrobium sp.]|nr:sigma-54 dependent transcriptional regulator [Brumimicrobium sp.]
MDKYTLLIIDDDVDICMLLKRFFERKEFRVRIAFSGNEGLEILKKERIDLVLSDFRLPDKDGFEMLKIINGIRKDIPVIIITGYSDVNQAVKAIRQGAYEYVTKPIYPEEILFLVEDALNKREASRLENKTVNQDKEQKNLVHTRYLIPDSEYSDELQKKISLVASTNMTVVIIGESGTGKEVVARMIHEASPRNDQAFIPVDCGALTQELAASELFGHVKGAFTGATSDKKGSFELANHGTLFLDEVGNLSYENQVKLLRALQERVIQRVGSEKTTPIDVRIIVATNENLELAIQRGTFRMDIFYRINEFQIELKPLRDNREELEAFFQFFLNQSNQELTKEVKGIDAQAWQVLANYPWPGNTRELKNVVKYAVLMANSEKIYKEDLPKEVINYKSGNTVQVETDSLLLKDATEKAEIKAIVRALELAKNNKSKTAELLGVDRKTLYNKLNTYGLLND